VKPDINQQLQRIKEKLKKAGKCDSKYEIFGASEHHYKLNKINKEELDRILADNDFKLPEDFYQFLVSLGTGAGPYYGISKISKLLNGNDNMNPSKDCILYPKMSIEEWNNLIAPILDDNISDEEYDKAHERIMGGLAYIGTQGCEYDMYIVLNGSHCGRVIYTDSFYENQPFFFVYETTFLDWYERWLDEIIAGYDISWFGTKMSGDETALINFYTTAKDDETRLAALNSMFKFKKCSSGTILFLKACADVTEDKSCFTTMVSLICKTSPIEGADYVLRLLAGDDNDILSALTTLWHYFKDNLNPYIPFVKEALAKTESAKALTYAGYILNATNSASLNNFERFLLSNDVGMVKDAIYASCSAAHANQRQAVDLAVKFLQHLDDNVFHAFIMFWPIFSDSRLLHIYEHFLSLPQFGENLNFSGRIKESIQQM